MEFTLSLEQELLSDGATRLLAEHCSTEQLADPAVRSRLWRQVVELGWCAMAVPETQGGLGSYLEDMAVLFMTLGRGLFRQPLLSASVQAVRILQQAPAERSATLLQGIAVGERVLSCALYEPHSRYGLLRPRTQARREGDGYSLDGSKVMVADGEAVQQVLISAQLVEEGGYGIFLVDLADAHALVRESHLHIDDEPSADYHFKGLRVPREGLVIGPCPDLGFLEDSADELRILRCAELVGAMERSIALTVDYLKLRKQFGTEIANFQAIQHQLAELFIQNDQARSSVYAAIAAHGGEVSSYRAKVSGCVMNVTRLAKQAVGQAIHLHGGIGFTTEHEVGHHFRKAVAEEKRLGDYAYHLQRLTELVGSRYQDTVADAVERAGMPNASLPGGERRGGAMVDIDLV